MEQKEIRFIDSNYNELFRIPNGGSITINYPDGHRENRTCEYIDDYHTKIGSSIFHICQFAEIMDQNNQTYTPGEMEKYTLENITQEEFEFMFAPQQKDTERGCIGYLRADFDTGKSFYSTWNDESQNLKTDEFKQEFDEVINYFRQTSATPLLKSRSDMYNMCYTLKPTAYKGDPEIKGFKVITDKHTYYLKCKPRLGDYDLYCYCYHSQQLCKYMDLQFVKKNYADIDRDKFYKTDSGLMEVYYNPDSNEGGQFVELTIGLEDIKEAAQLHKNKDDFFSHLEMVSKGVLYDVGTTDFRDKAKWFMKSKADFEGCTDKTMKALKKYAGIEPQKSHKKTEPER